MEGICRKRRGARWPVRRVVLDRWHPAVLLAFFAGAVALTVLVQHPAFQLAAFVSAVALLLSVRGAAAWRTVAATVPVLVLVAALNPLVNAQGATVLFLLPWGRPYTAEALLYGLQTGLALVTVLLWFASLNALSAGEAVGSLLGGALPGAALVLTMVLRLVPRFGTQARKVSDAFAGLGGRAGTGTDVGAGVGGEARRVGAARRLRQGGRELSALATWALEGSMATADSMRARGFGSGRPTRYERFRFAPRDGLMAATMAVLFVLAAAGVAAGRAAAQLVPTVALPPTDAAFCASLVSFTLFLALPALANETERLRWRFLFSRM